MGKFDAGRFNGFVKKGLVKGLYDDFRRCLFYNEADVQAATYHCFRKFLRMKGRDHLIVRCKPTLQGPDSKLVMPDVVVFKIKKPVYAIELKVYPKPNGVIHRAVQDDVNKLDKLVKKYGMAFGFLVVVYDEGCDLDRPDRVLRKEGIEKVSVVEINMRFDVKTGRQRRAYQGWRKRFDTIWVAQRGVGT